MLTFTENAKIIIMDILNEIKRFFHSKILRRKYFRSGSCAQCGRCCVKIHIRHGKDIVKKAEDFEKLKDEHLFYKNLAIMGEDEAGLIFECTKFDKETKKCTDHKNRPIICRKYPMEEIYEIGGDLSDNCGFKFTPIYSFEEILKNTKNR